MVINDLPETLHIHEGDITLSYTGCLLDNQRLSKISAVSLVLFDLPI